MGKSQDQPRGGSEIILYQSEDGRSRIEVRMEGGTVWLTQGLMAELFLTTPQNITMHIRGIYAERELEEGATCKPYLQVRQEGSRKIERQIKHYNLDMILAVGYRVRSPRGTQFRQWATERLKEYLVKGFVLDDERLKQAGGGVYFDELLERIRDIRSSEKVFWKKVLEIYATSMDYNPDAKASQLFFKTVQNKMHWAAHGHTAAEIIQERADAGKPHMGLTSWSGGRPRKSDVAVAKNYLSPVELDTLNRIVSLYLDFAELQAGQRRPMSMKDWIAKLDDFLRISEREILDHAGKVSQENARLKAEAEYDKFRAFTAAEPGPVEKDFENALKKLKQLEGKRARRKSRN